MLRGAGAEAGVVAAATTELSLVELVAALSGRLEAALAAAWTAACCFANGELDRREEEDLPFRLLVLDPELVEEQLEFEDSERLRPPKEDRDEKDDDEEEEG